MAPGDKNAGRDEAAYRLNLGESQAEALRKQGVRSGEKRGKSYEPSSLRLPNPHEEDQLEKAATASNQKRTHVTEKIANQYRDSRG
ncbi:hypothetical protein AnigIFM60653_010924 [Aspergillus niger]|nr:hypothetical protein AnigIFM49718_004299 [Aspergillus niger]GKZ88309.1 hypothetical protein AnigIFM59636_008166 [Aspergillus niger]GLA01070.1 hypothetical protein AnigIFM60653_010924 [Aspergillus niger]GLA37777.1 hypothetical protein AnigIFM63309_004750 [Aspergillus niger]